MHKMLNSTRGHFLIEGQVDSLAPNCMLKFYGFHSQVKLPTNMHKMLNSTRGHFLIEGQVDSLAPNCMLKFGLIIIVNNED